jgi:predicted small lipoprotein YifL
MSILGAISLTHSRRQQEVNYMSLIIKPKSLSAIFVLTLMLTGCGQKGALYLPEETAVSQQETSTPVDNREKKSQ